jgi:hypothetical protein
MQDRFALGAEFVKVVHFQGLRAKLEQRCKLLVSQNGKLQE